MHPGLAFGTTMAAVLQLPMVQAKTPPNTRTAYAIPDLSSKRNRWPGRFPHGGRRLPRFRSFHPDLARQEGLGNEASYTPAGSHDALVSG